MIRVIHHDIFIIRRSFANHSDPGFGIARALKRPHRPGDRARCEVQIGVYASFRRYTVQSTLPLMLTLTLALTLTSLSLIVLIAMLILPLMLGPRNTCSPTMRSKSHLASRSLRTYKRITHASIFVGARKFYVDTLQAPGSHLPADAIGRKEYASRATLSARNHHNPDQFRRKEHSSLDTHVYFIIFVFMHDLGAGRLRPPLRSISASKASSVTTHTGEIIHAD